MLPAQLRWRPSDAMIFRALTLSTSILVQTFLVVELFAQLRDAIDTFMIAMRWMVFLTSTLKVLRSSWKLGFLFHVPIFEDTE